MRSTRRIFRPGQHIGTSSQNCRRAPARVSWCARFSKLPFTSRSADRYRRRAAVGAPWHWPSTRAYRRGVDMPVTLLKKDIAAKSFQVTTHPHGLRQCSRSGAVYFFLKRAASTVLARSRLNSFGSNSSPIQSIWSACSGWLGSARMANSCA